MQKKTRMPVPTPSLKSIPVEDVPVRSTLQPPAAPSLASSLVDHLEELRRRFLICLAGAGVLAIAGYFFSDSFIHYLAGQVGPFVFLKPAEAFLVKLKIGFYIGLLVAAPLFLYHFWRYVAVALTRGEKQVAYTALPASYLLFIAGTALAWFGILPTGLQYLLSFATDDMRAALSVESCFDFAFSLTLGMGLLFQLPLVLCALAGWGLIDAEWLARYRRHAIVGIFLIAAVITPGPDLLSQCLLAVPTYLLFEASVVVVKLIGRQPSNDLKP